MFLTEFSKFLYRHYGPTDIRSVQTDEKPGVRFKKFFCFFYKKRTVRRAWDTVKSDPMPGKLYQRTHDRIVFHRGNKYMVSRFQQSFQKNIQTGRDIGSEDYIFAFSGCEMKQAEKLFASLEDLFFNRIGSLITSTVHIDSRTIQVIVNSLCHGGSLWIGSTCLIQIYFAITITSIQIF